MIVVTVGSQLPFNRMISVIDDLASTLDEPIFAQIGEGSYEPKNIEWAKNVKASEFDEKLQSCRLIISHAGIGTVLKAYKYAKPVILMPRLRSLKEHRNDHQLATVSSLRGRRGIYIAENIADMRALLAQDLLPAVETEGDRSRKDTLRQFVRQVASTAVGDRSSDHSRNETNFP